jgi:hypothetical protein
MCDWDKREEPILEGGRRRDCSLSYTVEHLAGLRGFRHLTEAAIQSYLLFLAESGRSSVVRTDIRGFRSVDAGEGGNTTSDPPFYMLDTYGHAMDECPTCHHKRYEHKTRRIYVAPDAPKRSNRDTYKRGIAFDIGNAAARVAWRLGTSCIVCGVFCGVRQRQEMYRRDSILGRLGTVYTPMCQACLDAEIRDRRKWRKHDPVNDPPKEWLLLMAAERMRKGVAAKPAQERVAA